MQTGAKQQILFEYKKRERKAQFALYVPTNL